MTDKTEKSNKRRERTKKVLSILWPIFAFVIAGLVIFFMLRGDRVVLDSDFWQQVNWWWLAVAIIIPFTVMLIESIRLLIVMRVSTGYFKPWLCVRCQILKRFFAMTTPFMLGGQPYQLYYMTKNGLSVANSTSVTLSAYITGRIAFQLVTGIIIISLFARLAQLDSTAVTSVSITISIIVHVGLTVFMCFVAFGRTISRFICHIVLALLVKIRLVQNKRSAMKKVDESLWQYHVSLRKLRKRPIVFAMAIILHMLSFFLHLGMIVFIYAALFGWNWQVIPLLLLAITLTEYLAMIFVIPGGTGGMELFFLAIFATLMPMPQIVIALVLWKALSFVLPILCGLPIILIDSVKKNSKNRLNQKNSMQ